MPSTVQAGDGWRVVDTAGTVRFGGPGFTPVALAKNAELPGDAWVETSANGRVILARGLETIIVEPKSRVQLPAAPVAGNTQVLQTLGSAIYKIGKQPKPHFQVDTPYLAAVVKGTEFTVTVEDGEASVKVSEGLVEVTTPDESDSEFVRPGFTAAVSREHRGDVVVEPTPEKAEAAPPVETPSDKSVKNEGGEPQTITISEPIGPVEVDVKETSGGLVTTDIVPTIDVVQVNDEKVSDSEAGSGKEDKPSGDDKVDDGASGGGSPQDVFDIKDSSGKGPDGQSEVIGLEEVAEGGTSSDQALPMPRESDTNVGGRSRSEN
jgi:hypothetical protein